jgi:CRP-like cAMP-binding protein
MCAGAQTESTRPRTFAVVPPAERLHSVNLLLEALPGVDRRRLLSQCEIVDVAFAEVLYAPPGELDHAYFPIDSFISLIMPIDADCSLVGGLVGNEGMFGIPLALGVNASPMRAVVQGAGSALRIDTAAFRRELARTPALRRCIERYVSVHVSQLAQTAGCTRFHLVEARLARWLLMTQDRAHARSFHATQEFLALMLGVRRVGVTKAASALQQRDLIRYSRGNVTVLDRRGLKAASCGCYDADRSSYDRILG